MINQRKGFTLLESLFALVIIAFIWVLMVRIPYARWQDSVESRMFFDQLEAQLNLTQQDAITYRQTQTIRFDARQQSIRFPNKILTLPQNWNLSSNYSFYYLPNGRVDQFRTVTIHHSSGKRMAIVFQLGSGKFEFKES